MSTRLIDPIIEDHANDGTSARSVPAVRALNTVATTLTAVASKPSITSARPNRYRSTICAFPPPGPPFPMSEATTTALPIAHR